MSKRGNPAIKVRLEPEILAQLRQKVQHDERGRGGGVAYYLRALAYRDLGLPPPSRWAPTGDACRDKQTTTGGSAHTPARPSCADSGVHYDVTDDLEKQQANIGRQHVDGQAGDTTDESGDHSRNVTESTGDHSAGQPRQVGQLSFLETLYEAYLRQTGQSYGVLERFTDLYRTFIAIRGARDQYTVEHFSKDLYRLDAQLAATTSDGATFRIHRGATAARTRSKLLLLTSREGLELTYYGIEFYKSVPALTVSADRGLGPNVQKSCAPGPPGAAGGRIKSDFYTLSEPQVPTPPGWPSGQPFPGFKDREEKNIRASKQDSPGASTPTGFSEVSTD